MRRLPWSRGNIQAMNISPLVHSASTQVRAVARPLALALLGGVLVLLLAVGLSTATGTPLESLLSDPARVAGHAPYIGFISNLGALLWCGATAVLLLGAAIVSRLGDRGWARFLLFSALVTGMLLVDDFFMLHEKASEIHWRLSEEVIFTFYGAVLAIYLARFRKHILSTEYIPLALAFFFMGLSLLVDRLDSTDGMPPAPFLLLEDGSKFLAIVCWLHYFARISYRRVIAATKPPPQEAYEHP
jgi:hypothetical protein